MALVTNVTNVTTVYGAEETATQKCWHHLLEAKDNQQRKAAIAFKDCVRKETSFFKLGKSKSTDSKSTDSKSADSKSTDEEKKLTSAEKRKLTAAERKQLEDAEKEEFKALKEELLAEKKAARERTSEEREQILAEKERACAEDPKGKGCKTASLQLNKIYEKLKILGVKSKEKAQAEKLLKKQEIEERKARIKAEKELAKQARIEEQERIKAEKAAIKAEKKRLKAEWKKACAEDPESKACIEGQPTQKLKKTLSKIKKSLGG